jgi:hypothetical protein
MRKLRGYEVRPPGLTLALIGGALPGAEAPLFHGATAFVSLLVAFYHFFGKL